MIKLKDQMNIEINQRKSVVVSGHGVLSGRQRCLGCFPHTREEERFPQTADLQKVSAL